jgi:hypothetical protein
MAESFKLLIVWFSAGLVEKYETANVPVLLPTKIRIIIKIEILDNFLLIFIPPEIKIVINIMIFNLNKY